MGFINVAERTINAKLVYYGVGVGGKTTSLQQVHGILCPRNEVQLLSIATEEDSTLMFDFLPINLGNVGGFKIRIKGYTVPGQPKYRRMRQYVLQGADAVVFVVDSQQSRLQENLESLQSMRDNLRARGGSVTSESIPIVMQYNKRDLDDILSEAELDRHFRFRDGIESFPSVATEGHGVFEAFVEAAGRLIESKVALYGLDQEVDARTVADEARQRLWDACDEARRSRSVVPIEQIPQVRLEVADGEELPLDPIDWQAPTLLDEIHRPPTEEAQPEVVLDLGDEDFQLDYSLNDMSGPVGRPVESDQVLTNEDLDIDLDAVVDFGSDTPPPEIEDSMLDQTVQANLQLAEEYGDLDERRLRYERKVRELVDCTQSAVHDLRRPLGALGVMLKLIARGTLGDVPDKVRNAVETGLEGIDVMSKLVQDLLDSSQLDHDGVQLDFRTCDPAEVAREVARTLHFELEARSVDLRIDEMPEIVADPWGLTKVLMNLVGNAVVYAAPDRDPVIEVGCEDCGDVWQLFVRDNGIGIPEADRPRLFRRFERGSNTSGISGSGLGLHIVREIVLGHGGTVSFASQVGAGTTFFLRLPKKPVQAPHSPVSSVG
ncbi:MAG: hypothetical protein KDE27_03675 [Planctomycetes bacterium]|nr:hypothetical protein [Planctomycetota bacterium]